MVWTRTRVVVTGAGGFIGSHLTERLLALGSDVTAFVRYNSRNDAGLLEMIGGKRKDVRIVYGEIRELETVRKVIHGADVVFHLAALVGIPYSYVHPHEVIEVNTIGMLNVLTGARDAGARKVVVVSSSEVYGTALYVPIDEKHPKQAQSPYAASKIAADAIALSFCNAFDLPVTIARPFNAYGPRQSDRAIIPTIISQALKKGEIELGNVTPTRDFTFVTDTVEGLVRLAASDNSAGQEVNLGSGREISIGDLAKMIATFVGREVSVRQTPERSRPAKSEVQRLVADYSRARQLVGWEPQVPLEHGLPLTIEWIRENQAMYDPAAYRI